MDGPLSSKLKTKNKFYVNSKANTQFGIQFAALLAALRPQVNIVGDIHGQLWDLEHIFHEKGRPR